MKNFTLAMAVGLGAVALIGCQPTAGNQASNAPEKTVATDVAPAEAVVASSPVETETPTTAEASPADACGEVIAFAAGADSATVSGKLSGYDTCTFRLTANAGQQLHAQLEGSTYLIALLFAPTRQDTAIAGPSDKLDATLPVSSEYQIRIGQVRAEARRNSAPKAFKLTVQLR